MTTSAASAASPVPPGDAARPFASRMLDIFNDGALAFCVAIGHRTRLFDTMDGLPAATAEEIAGAAGLDARYVREWLAALVTGGIVRYEPSTGRYTLPPEHADLLTRRAAPENLAAFAQFIPMLCQVEEPLLASFRSGGGVPYARYARFHEIMAEMSSQTVVAALFDGVLPLVPGLRERLQQGVRVLDVGCGQGRALTSLASAFPNSRFRGIDLAEEVIRDARATVGELGLRNVVFEVGDAAAMAFDSRFDLVTGFDVIHDQAHPRRVLDRIRRALVPGGVFLMQDIATHSRLEENAAHPIAPFLYTLSLGHCMTVSLAQGGEGLGTCWGRELAMSMLEEAGFRDVEVHELPHDLFNYFYVARV